MDSLKLFKIKKKYLHTRHEQNNHFTSNDYWEKVAD